MSTMDQTGTLWVILMTPQKKLLAKVSSLKKFGKIKIEELKVMYGRKGVGGWIFQILGQPQSQTFSFHDGEVVRKNKTGYLVLRSHSIRIYFMLVLICLLWMSCAVVHRFFSMSAVDLKPAVQKDEVTTIPAEVKPKSVKKEVEIVQAVDPRAHEYFLQAKREFQYGRLTAAIKILEQNMMGFDPSDRKAASEMISNVFFLHCEKFRSQHEERKAVIACEKAVKYSSHPKAEIFLSVQEEKARALYLEGYTAVKFNPSAAKQKFALVLQSAKSKSTWRGKAQYQLRKLKTKDANS